MSSRLQITVLLLLTMVLSAFQTEANQCKMRYRNCEYHLKLVGMGCSNPRNSRSAFQDMIQSDQPSQYIEEDITSISYVSTEELKALEKRLLNVVEELSVRTLRHMRHIRNNLRSMKFAMGGGSRALCPKEFLTLGTWPSCYRLSAFSATWKEAKEYCTAFGADLVTIDNIKESYIVDYLIKSKLEYLEPKGWWTAGYYIKEKDTWMWWKQTGLSPITLSHWALSDTSKHRAQCMLAYRPAGYRWMDTDCSELHHFICEINVESHH